MKFNFKYFLNFNFLLFNFKQYAYSLFSKAFIKLRRDFSNLIPFLSFFLSLLVFLITSTAKSAANLILSISVFPFKMAPVKTEEKIFPIP